MFSQKNEKTRKKESAKNKKYLLRFIYFLIWIIIIVRIFYNDLFNNIIPISTYTWLAEYSIIIILLIMAISFLCLGIRKTIFEIIKFFVFPIIFLFGFLPLTGFKMIISLYNFASRTISFTKIIRYKAILIILFFLSLYMILTYTSETLIKLSMALLLLVLIAHFLRRFYTISKPIHFFNFIENILFRGWEKFKSDSIIIRIKEMKELNSQDEIYNKEKIEILKTLWFVNRIFIRLAKYLQSFKADRIVVGYFICAVSFSLLLSITVFAFEYYALLKVYPSSFIGLDNTNIVDCFYLSITTITTVNFGDIIPITTLAKLLVITEIFFGVIILVILFFIFTTITIEKYRKDLEIFVNDLNKKGLEIISLIDIEFNEGLHEIIPGVIDSIQNDMDTPSVKRWVQIDDNENIL